MNKNMGTPDRVVRAFAAIALVIAWVAAGPAGRLAIVLYGLAAAMAITAAVGTCPLYSIFRLRTCPLQRVTASAVEHTVSR